LCAFLFSFSAPLVTVTGARETSSNEVLLGRRSNVRPSGETKYFGLCGRLSGLYQRPAGGAAGIPAVPFPAGQPPGIRSKVSRVLVDALVVDQRSGQPIDDLAQAKGAILTILAVFPTYAAAKISGIILEAPLQRRGHPFKY
jgi:hypothetical protein